jgi:hypothetical protein
VVVSSQPVIPANHVDVFAERDDDGHDMGIECLLADVARVDGVEDRVELANLRAGLNVPVGEEKVGLLEMRSSFVGDGENVRVCVPHD